MEMGRDRFIRLIGDLVWLFRFQIRGAADLVRRRESIHARVIRQLYTGYSYRVSEARWPSLRYLVRAFRLITSERLPAGEAVSGETIAFCDEKDPHDPNLVVWIEANSGKRPGIFFCKSDPLRCLSPAARGLLLLSIGLQALVAWIVGLGGRQRWSSCAILPLEITECLILVASFRAFDIRRVYLTGAYHKEMNLFALLCRRSGVTLCKVASETPLSFHYPFLVADEFTLSSAYHLEEKEALSGGHFVDRYLFWTPTKIFDVLERYLSGDSLSPPRFEVGFVSSGIWLRRRMGQKEAVPGYFASEEALLEALRDYLEGRNIRLKIYLHPLERRNPDHYREAVAYYRDFFGDFPVEVGDGETNTREHFEEVDICVAAASTTLIERLFFGFKALYAPFFIPTFPLPGTTLARISAKDRETFFKLLDRWIGVPAQTFFAENALEKFHHTHFGRIVDRYLASRGEKAHIPEVRSRP